MDVSNEQTVSVTSDGSADAPKSDTGRVHIRDLRKTFGEIVACEDISLTIDDDEFVVLVGPSGCGKTTTLRSIAGLEIPDSGEISISGKEVTYEKPKDRDIAFVFQDIILYPHMSVRKNIRFGLDMKTDMPKDEKNEMVEEVASMLGIGDYLDRKPTALSGGQQQRVSLGRAMVMEPDVFLLDEPFSALDANLRDTLRVEVKKLQRTLQTPMIFVTHDQEEAMTLGDSIVVMNDGHIQQIGTPHEIYNEPENLFVATFIGSPSVNLFECVVEPDAGLVNDVFTIPHTAVHLESLAVDAGDAVTLGIRPEHLQLDAEETLFEATLEVVEPHGERDVIHMRANDTDITAVTPQRQIDRERDRLSVTFDPDELWLFDASGDRLL
ncbi:ABC transporter ATP-binding protein [Natronosalvus amylolyticus]|uniref:ABC transporter ATP-binding protein n=1 Tax=Natronosalvus amylolyticus TaxID=2961994 RepID=UPI0020C96F8E|nr:ABC transporter ATP-binding protein [Natronosalvus amylolyticus]